MNHFDCDDFALRRLVEIRPTECEWGVFARRKIRKDAVVGRVHGTLIADSDYCSDYCIEMDERSSLEPHAPFRYLNHSCKPNCQIFGYDMSEIAAGHGGGFVEEYARSPDDLDGMLFIQAIRKIRSGDQLTIDYAWPANMAIKCLCGKKKCRGWVVAQEEVHLVNIPR